MHLTCAVWKVPEPYREILYKDSIYIYSISIMALDRPMVTFQKLPKVAKYILKMAKFVARCFNGRGFTNVVRIERILLLTKYAKFPISFYVVFWIISSNVVQH